jgi:hypothetical protein
LNKNIANETSPTPKRIEIPNLTVLGTLQSLSLRFFVFAFFGEAPSSKKAVIVVVGA